MSALRVKFSAFETQDRLDSFNLKQMDCPHNGLGGQTPNDATRAAVATGWQARRIGDRELDVLCMDGGVRTVGKKGIKFDRLEFWHDDLVPFLGLRSPNFTRRRFWRNPRFRGRQSFCLHHG